MKKFAPAYLFALFCLFAVQGFSQVGNPDPYAMSVTTSVNNNGGGASFIVKAWAPRGVADIQEQVVTVGSPNMGGGTCTAMLYQGLYVLLLNDAGTDWTGWYPVGSTTATTENSRCKIPANSTSKLAVSAWEQWFNVALEFKPLFNGSRPVTAWAANSSWISAQPWINAGSITVNSTSNGTPLPVITLTSSTGNSSSRTLVFTTNYFGATGGSSQFGVTATNTFNTAGACWSYAPQDNPDGILLNDASNGWSAPYSQGPQSNSQCSEVSFSQTGSGTSKIHTITLNFKDAFAGNRYIWGYAANSANQANAPVMLGSLTVTGPGTGDSDVPWSSGTAEVTDIVQTAVDPYSGATLNVPTTARPAAYLEVTSPSGNRVAKLGDQLTITLSNVKPQTQVWIRETCLEDPYAIGGGFCGGGYVGTSTSAGTYTWDTTVAPSGGYLGGHLYTVWVGNWDGSQGPQPDADIIGSIAMWFTNSSGSPSNPEMAAISNQ